MNIFKWLQNFIQYIGSGVRRIFSASEDDYPETGAQPFEGDPYKEKN